MTEQVSADLAPEVKPILDTPKPETVSKTAYDEVTASMHKFKEQVKSFENAKVKDDEAKLVQSNEWQKAYDAEKVKRIDLEDKQVKLEQSFVRNEKMGAIEKEALKMGIHKEQLSDLKFFPFEDVQIQKTIREDGTSDISVTGAVDAMERFKLIRPKWFGAVGALNTNMSDPEVVGSTSVSIKDINAAYAKGDMEKYKRLHAEYQKKKG